MSEEFLFIGGCADGKRMSIPGELMFDVRVPTQSQGFSVKVHDLYEPCEFETYSPMKIAAENEVFVVYALFGMRSGEVLSRLISGYKKL